MLTTFFVFLFVMTSTQYVHNILASCLWIRMIFLWLLTSKFATFLVMTFNDFFMKKFVAFKWFLMIHLHCTLYLHISITLIFMKQVHRIVWWKLFVHITESYYCAPSMHAPLLLILNSFFPSKHQCSCIENYTYIEFQDIFLSLWLFGSFQKYD